MSTGCMYLGWKKEECKMCVKAEENSLGWHANHHTIRISHTVSSENSTQLKEFKQQDNEEILHNLRGKAMHGQYVRQIEDKDKDNTW